MFKNGYLTMLLLAGTILLPILVGARFCDGGHICSLPRECCNQGCCPPYQNSLRHLPPAADHVLNLLFINHWYVWCVVVAIVLIILCFYSIWRKRINLCGWRFSEHNIQSEGDSAGSCYVPPLYSRCNSFHHPPPPYTEVTSKPDLYPIVFTCNSENSKNGASYLMVQYFRNYIVRPPGSLSATSTIDSLNSSLLCNTADANNLVPPPYSRVASPDVEIHSNIQQQFSFPRSASLLNYSEEELLSSSNSKKSKKVGDGNSHNNLEQNPRSLWEGDILRSFSNIPSGSNKYEKSSIVISSNDQKCKYISNSSNSFNDIFGKNCCNTNENNELCSNYISKDLEKNILHKSRCINQFLDHNTLYNSCNSIGDITIPVTNDNEYKFHDLNALRQGLETCCQLLKQQQMPSISNCTNSLYNGQLTKICSVDMKNNFISTSNYSAGSSVLNIDSPSSPPQATSPTGEIKIDQITQKKFDCCEEKNINTVQISSSGRPVSLQTKKKFLLKPHKGLYFQISNTNTKVIKSPVNTTNLFPKNWGKKIWTSRSAPTTPGSFLPTNCLRDDSPLLNEHDENDEDIETTT